MTYKQLPFFFFISLFIFTAACTEKFKQSNKVLVRLDKKELKLEDFSAVLIKKLQNGDYFAAKNEEYVLKLKNSIIEDFVRAEVVRLWAEKNSIRVTKTELESEIKKIRVQYPDDISFRAALADENIAFDQWLDSLRKNILEKKVEESLVKNVSPPTNEEIDLYYKQNLSVFKQKKAVKLRQILVEQALDAENVLKLLKSGSKFDELAKKYSIAPEAKEGGELGWIHYGSNDVFNKAFELGINFYSKEIKSEFGYHILQTLDKRAEKTLSLAEVKTRIVNDLWAHKKQQAYAQWIRDESQKLKFYLDKELFNAIKVDIQNN